MSRAVDNQLEGSPIHLIDFEKMRRDLFCRLHRYIHLYLCNLSLALALEVNLFSNILTLAIGY